MRQLIKEPAAVAEGQLANEQPQQCSDQHVAREVNIKIQAGECDEHRERNGRIAEAPVGLKR